MARKYPIGIQNFAEIRCNDYLYIDKTRVVYDLVQSGKYYFLSRPRRFGKSLLLSTIEAYFLGKKELFDGLALGELEKEWPVCPVLHLDLNIQKYDSPASLTAILNDALSRWEQRYGSSPTEKSLSLRFSGIIRRAAEMTGKNVVILVDEYDKPMIQAIGNDALQSDYRNTLKAFYSVLKSCDGYIRFALLTGVTKFSKVSIFSDLNNLRDISLLPQYATICGVSEDELEKNFSPDIDLLASACRMSRVETCRELREMYDGYHFAENSPGIFNPFSLLNTFASMKFGKYWFETGTPTLLVELLKRSHYNLDNLPGVVARAETLIGIDTMLTDPIPLFYQSGYLTIKRYDPRFDRYFLDFPNREVEEGFLNFLVPAYIHPAVNRIPFDIANFVEDVETGHVDTFMQRLKSFMADTPYVLVRDQEIHYQNVLFIIFKLLGFYTHAEYHTSCGRIDLTVQTPDYIYVMEFKLQGTAEEAIRQINDRQYAAPFASDPRTLYKVGVNFSSELRNIERWIVEENR